MPGPVGGNTLIEALINGGEKAARDFAEVSGEEWFDEAPEYVLTTYAGVGLKKLENGFALFEVGVDRTRAEAGATRKGAPRKGERRNGRIDIVSYWSDGRPRGAIEVKSPIFHAEKRRLKPDFEELCHALAVDRCTSLQFCAFLFYASVSEPERKHKNADHKLRSLLERVHGISIEVACKIGEIAAILKPGKIHTDKVDGGAWCIACIVFVHKGRELPFA
jgi:hypothetical protein